MKSTKNNLLSLVFLLMMVASMSANAQSSRADIFSDKSKITWLGIDFTHAKYIGVANQKVMGIGSTANNGDVTPEEFRDKYTLGWNRIFIDEQKKYDIADVIHHTSVDYALEVAEKANSAASFDKLYTDNPGDFKLLDESGVDAIVKGYDFQKHEGIGLLFIVGGMSKGQEKSGVWVTFVDMQSKTVLLTKYLEGKPAGFGLRNYWAKSFWNVMQETKDKFKSWKK